MSALTAVYFIPMIKKKDAAYHARTFHVTGNCQNVMKKNSMIRSTTHLIIHGEGLKALT